jgi:hypothetical protein
MLLYIRSFSETACSFLNEYSEEPRHISESVWDSRIDLVTVPGAQKLFATAPILHPVQPTGIQVTAKASQNALLGSDCSPQIDVSKLTLPLLSPIP